jgi:hypothetical protein
MTEKMENINCSISTSCKDCIYKINCGVVQWLARKIHNLEVSGSNPLPATNNN